MLKVGDRVIEIGGGKFKCTVVTVDMPYIYVVYDNSIIYKHYHDMFRLLTPLEFAML